MVTVCVLRCINACNKYKKDGVQVFEVSQNADLQDRYLEELRWQTERPFPKYAYLCPPHFHPNYIIYVSGRFRCRNGGETLPMERHMPTQDEVCN